MSAQTRVELMMRALDQQVVVQRAEYGPETERVVKLPRAALVLGAQAITAEPGAIGKQGLEKSVGMAAGHRHGGGAIRFANRHGPGSWHERADDKSGACIMRPEHGEGITMTGADDGGYVDLGGPPGRCAHDSRVPPFSRL